MSTVPQIVRHRRPGLCRGHLARRARLGAADRNGPHQRGVPRPPYARRPVMGPQELHPPEG